MRAFLLPLLVLALVPLSPGKTPETGSKAATKSVEAIAKEAKPSVVKVLQEGREGLDGLGTGFVVSADGLIATNLHVIGEARRLEVEMSDGTKHEVTEITATDAHWDLALLRIPAENLKPLTLGDSDQIKQGQPVVAMGNPEGLAFSIVDGVVSEYPDVVREVPMIRLAMPIERGNSGGPLLDRQGHVLGLITMKNTVTDNLGYAMPVNELKHLIAKPNPVPMDRWMTIGVLNPKAWETVLGSRWTQRSGTIKSAGMGQGFGGRTICLSKTEVNGDTFEIAVNVRLDDESGAAGLLFCAQDKDHCYGFYPSNGRMRLTRFEGPDVLSWVVLDEIATDAYRPGSWNHLRIRVEPEQIIGWVNGQKVLVSQDTGLRGGQAGICRFRSPSAEYRGFRVGADLGEKVIPETVAAAIDMTLDQFASSETGRDETLDELLEDPASARRMLVERRRDLEKQAAALRDLEKDLHRRAVTKDILGELAKPEEKIDLLRLTLLLARHDNAEIDVPQYLQQFTRMVDELKADPEIKKGTAAAVKRLNRFLFEESGFHGSRHDYGSRSNSYMSELLDDREGLPITLSVLYIELAQRLGVSDVFGVPLPGKFMVGWKDGPEGEVQLVDAFERGKALSVADAALELSDRGQFDEAELQAATKREIILRMLRNLLGAALDEEDSMKDSLPYLDLTVAIDPEASVERITRAQMRQRLGQNAAAREDVQWLIEHFPESAPDEFRAKLDQWMQSLRD